jgi:choline dehydrogenase-like flavoprotein
MNPFADTHDASVLIIGAGASGAVVALRLAQAGVDVLCLEQGSWPDRSSYRGSEVDFELSSGKQWSPDPRIRKGPGDYPVDYSACEIPLFDYHGVGGGTVLMGAQWLRMSPRDFVTRTSEGVGDDWPLTYEEIARHYDRTDRDFGVSGLGGDPAYPERSDPPYPPLPIGRAGMMIARAHKRLRWHWWPATNAILSTSSNGRHPCAQRGTCNQGCNEGAKGSTDVSHWPRALAEGARLITGARVRRIVLNERGRASGVEWIDEEGNSRATSADVVVCAAGGIGTPRLLLASACSRFPDGLANRSGLVGRRLMVHPNARVSGWFDEPLRGWQGHSGALIFSMEFYRGDPRRGFDRGAKWGLKPSGGPMRTALPSSQGGCWGPDHHAWMARRFGNAVHWGIHCEDLPEETNGVELSADLDDHGLAIPKIRYKISANTRAMMDWNLDKATQSLQEAGAFEISVQRLTGTGHALGTARMGNNSATSVVDSFGFCHDVPNLAIVDGSVFVTASGVNPTSTIAALASRTAEALLEGRIDTEIHQRGNELPSERPRQEGPVSSVPLGRPPKIPEEVREPLASVADLLIPAQGMMPAASEVDVAGYLLDLVIASRPDLLRPLCEAIRDVAAIDLDGLSSLDSLPPQSRSTLLYVITGAYYMSTEVRRRIGFPGQEGTPADPREMPYVDEGLLDYMLEESSAAPSD